jgi:hypothetical protein
VIARDRRQLPVALGELGVERAKRHVRRTLFFRIADDEIDAGFPYRAGDPLVPLMVIEPPEFAALGDPFEGYQVPLVVGTEVTDEGSSAGVGVRADAGERFGQVVWPGFDQGDVAEGDLQ